jgi:predicted ATPase/class 3 adenylate cyclase
VTFLFTDIEGSTALWEQDGARMSQALAAHDALARSAVEHRHGTVVKITGDGVHAVFDDALHALAATLDMQLALADPAATRGVALRVRCGLHAGMVERRDNDYFGSSVNRAARIMSAAHGGQVLLSQAVVDCVREILPAAVSLRDLGNVRLKDLATPEHVYQVVHPNLRQDFPALRSLEATPNNLPQQATSFIGREKELEELNRLQATTRLLTLTGSGGCGKTRLSLQLAADALESFPDGAWFVELAPLSDRGLVPPTVATVLGLMEESGRPISQTLTEHLKDKRLLLLLDNCEHLLDVCARLADALVRQCPYVTILASSREALGIAGEQTYRVPSLSLPNPKQAHTPISVAPFEAVQLFIDRALLARADFAVTNQNAPTLASICYRLDGIPLAIELAAARVRSLSVEEIDGKLDQRFRLLTGGSRAALPRQQTLRSLIDWSYDLLSDSEKRLLQRLSVFAGGWTLAAAEQVCAGGAVEHRGVLDLLTSLCDKSLVMVDQNDGPYRYRLLETVRQYVREKLLEDGDTEVVRERHRDYFLGIAETAKSALASLGREQSIWLAKLDLEQDNLRAVLAWSLDESQANEVALQLCGLLEQFWLRQAQSREGRQWCDAAVARAGPTGSTAIYAKAVLAAGTFAYRLGDYGAARTSLERALAVATGIGDRTMQTMALIRLGVAESLHGNFEQAQATYQQAVTLCQDTGDRKQECLILMNLALLRINQVDLAGATEPLNCALSLSRDLNDRALEASVLDIMGNQAWYRADLGAAQEHCEHSLSILRAMGARNAEGNSLRSLAKIASARGAIDVARTFFLDALAASREHGDPQYLDEIAIMAMALSKSEDAARFAGASDALRHAFGLTIWPVDRQRFHGYREQCRSVLGQARYDAAYEAGRALNRDGVVDMTRDWLQKIEGDVASAKSSRVSDCT